MLKFDWDPTIRTIHDLCITGHGPLLAITIKSIFTTVRAPFCHFVFLIQAGVIRYQWDPR